MYFTWKTVLITWWTGFLWHALTERILKQNPNSIRIFSRDEVKHFNMAKKFNDSKIRHLIWDIRDKDRLSRAMKGVDYVIHAAALKRLDIIEYNTEESVKTNIIWTLNLVSTGSIVPILQEKIKNWEDFMLTDERMTRFLISEDDAIELIFDAFKLWVWWEIIVPKLDSCTISVLMEAMKKVNNYDCKVKLMWLRPGEKIHELMINESEGSRIIFYKNRYIIQSLIENYKDLWEIEYVEKWEQVAMWDYSSEWSIVWVDKVIEDFGEYLKI